MIRGVVFELTHISCCSVFCRCRYEYEHSLEISENDNQRQRPHHIRLIKSEREQYQIFHIARESPIGHTPCR